MSRTRQIKPGFHRNELLAECDPLARLLFTGLWTIADRAGRLEDRPKRIKVDVLPYDNCDIDDLLQQLESRGFLIRYLVGGTRYMQIVNFHKNQQPHKNEIASTIPPPNNYLISAEPSDTDTEEVGEEYRTSTVQVPEQHPSTTPSTSLLVSSTSLLVSSTSLLGSRPKEHPTTPKIEAKEGDNTWVVTGEYAPQAAPPTQEKPKAKQTSYPTTFAITDAMRVWAAKNVPGFDIDAATEQWADSMRANTTKYKYTDWTLAWYTAMRNADKWAKERGTRNGQSTTSNNGQRRHYPTKAEQWDDSIAANVRLAQAIVSSEGHI